MFKMMRDIYIENINKLMKNSHITQVQLADEIGMSQPNLSKALNPKEKKMLTLEQAAAIADYFHVTIDSLIGRTANLGSNPKTIAQVISELLIDGVASATKVKVHEIQYEYPIGNAEETERKEVDTEYPAIFFPIFKNMHRTSHELKLLMDDIPSMIEYTNCLDSNREVNRVLNALVSLLPSFDGGAIAPETLRAFSRTLIDGDSE